MFIDQFLKAKKFLKKGKKMKKMFFVLNKYQNVVTHVFTCIFQGLFKNKVFRSVALVIKNLWDILMFLFTQTTWI